MRHVRAERQQAAAQIARSLKAWRKVGEQKAGASRPPIPQQGGAALGGDTRTRMEGGLGADLSQAEVHTGDESAQAAAGMGAGAFAMHGEGEAAAAPEAAAPPIAAKLLPGTIARKKKDDPASPGKSTQHAAGSSSKGEGDRVNHPVPGLYDSINGGLAVKKPLVVGNLLFKDVVIEKHLDGSPMQIETIVQMPGNDKVYGNVTRSLEVGPDGSKSLVMNMAFLDGIPKEQSWVTEDGKALKPGRGIPLQTYLSLRQMKLFGVEYGDLGKPNFKKVKLSMIVNQRTIWELAESTKKEPGVTESERLRRTHSVKYAETVITQAGAKIVDAHLEKPTTMTAREYAERTHASDEPKKRGLAAKDPVRKDFDIILTVAPFGTKSSVPSEIKDS